MKKPNYRKIITVVLLSVAFYILLLTLMLFFEKDSPDSGINSVGQVLWYSVVTLTTVGYGDLVPTTDGGRVVGFIFLFISLSMYAVIIGQITNLMTTINENRKLGLMGTKFKNHVVIIGWTDFGKAVTDQLVGAGRLVAIITKERYNVDLIRELYGTKAVFVLYSDFHNVDSLHRVNIEQSSIVFVNLLDDTEKLVYILNVKKFFKELDFIVTLDNSNLKNTFQSAGVTYAISKTEIASKLLASYIFEPDVALFTEEIIAYAETDEMFDMKEFKMLANNPYVNHTYGSVFYDLKRECNVVLVGLVKELDGKRKLHKNPEDDMLVEEGDYLIMIMNRQAVKKLTKMFKTAEGYIQM